MAQNDTEAGENIALGKKIIAVPVPNSPDPGNKIERLTDGNPKTEIITKEETTALWVQPGAVGWWNINPACLIVDLESVQSISGFSYHTAAGIAGVTWPKSIYIAVSDDQKTWKHIGDLVTLSGKHSKPPQEGYHEFTFSTRDVQTRGRYVAFGITTDLYVFTDEVEVYAGQDSWLTQPDKSIVYQNHPTDILNYMRGLVVRQNVSKRITNDSQSISDLIDRSKLRSTIKEELLQQLTAIQDSEDDLVFPSQEFKAIAPISDKHRQVLTIYGKFLAAQGFKPLTIWNQHRYAWLPFVATPVKAMKTSIEFSMLGNQFRSQSLLLTNAGTKPQAIKLQVKGVPTGAKGGWLNVDEVQWTDTFEGVMISDALISAEADESTYEINIPAGMTRKVWFTIDSSKLTPGNYKSSLIISGGLATQAVPFNCSVSTIAMKRPRLSLGMWDETDPDSLEKGTSHMVTTKNYRNALRLMRSHFVDTAWGKRAAVPWPGEDEFDAQGRLKKELDFSNFDKWLGDWPDARRFFVFINSGTTFAGAAMNTPRFDAAVGSWARALVEHMRELKRDPKQLGLMIIDESRTDEMDAIVVAWSKAVRASAPEIAIFQNPIWVRPDQIKHQEAITSADVLSPNMPKYYRGGNPVKTYYENLRQKGKDFWFYQCDGPVRLFDPQRYFRYQAWHVYSAGGTGQGFWAFGDAGPNSWNEYLGTHFTYSPVFIDKDTITNSIHWDSVREGMEDFEELAMLQDAINNSKNNKLRAEGQRVLDNAVHSVTNIWKDESVEGARPWITEHYRWEHNGFDPGLADRELVKVRAMLEQLR